MTSGQHIDYDALAVEALRGVVKACLAQVSRTGLVGDHHFYIAFNTQAPGVGMSKRLKEKYPVEMTIVLQHRFWDLGVDDDRFEVKLTFDGIPERLVVPFAAVKVFYDPSVPYVLQFEEVDTGAQGNGARVGPRRIGTTPPTGEADAGAGGPQTDATGLADGNLERRRPSRKARGEKASEGDKDVAERSSSDRSPRPEKAPSDSDRPKAPAPVPADKPAIAAVTKSTENGASSEDNDDAPDAGGGAKIFDLSKFRGKK